MNKYLIIDFLEDIDVNNIRTLEASYTIYSINNRIKVMAITMFLEHLKNKLYE